MASVMAFVQGDFPEIFMIGFAAGFIVCSLVYAIRAVVRLAVRILKS